MAKIAPGKLWILGTAAALTLLLAGGLGYRAWLLDENGLPKTDVDDLVAYQHLIGDIPYVRRRKPNPDAFHETLEVYVIVDEAGRVSKARVVKGEGGLTREVRDRLHKARFQPFIRDGKPAITRAKIAVHVIDPERPRRKSRPFPDGDLSSVVVVFESSMCDAECPNYQVKLTGSGEVSYTGFGYVTKAGRQSTRIAPAAVQALIDKFERAEFFSLDDIYADDGTDGHTTCLSVTVGDQTKSVVEYRGLSAGLPDIVSELQDEVLRTSGAEAWVKPGRAFYLPPSQDEFAAYFPNGCGLRSDGSDYASGGGESRR